MSKNLELKKYFTTYLFVIFIAVSFLLGLYYGAHHSTGGLLSPSSVSNGTGALENIDDPHYDYLKKNVNFNLFWDVWNEVKNTFVDNNVTDTKLFYGSLQGMVAALKDPYTAFLTPEITQSFTTELAGKFEGIGAEVSIKDDILTVVAPLPNTPAERAGILAGDYILKIDGVDTSGMSVDEAVMKIRGEKGTTVVLSIYRDGFDIPKDFSVARDTIQVDSVIWEIDADKIAYVRINQFNDNTLPLWNQAVTEILEKKAVGLIVDLRNNPGGLLDTGIAVSSDWVEKGTIVAEKGRDGQQKDYMSLGTARVSSIPTIVLINKGSASASEILAGALQDYGKAKLVGDVSFGKGSVQNFEVLPDGSALKITVGRWFTPLGRGIDGQGIKPDVTVIVTEEDILAKKDSQREVAKKMLQDPTFVYKEPNIKK